MITVKPFAAIRPKEECAHLVAALPYDVMNTEEACQIVAETEGGISFLQVDKPELLGGDKTPSEQYALAGAKIKEWLDAGVFVKEQMPAMYVYVLQNAETIQHGLVCTLSCKEYDEGKIKKHEYTRAVKEKDRVKHIEGCQAHTGPIFLMAKDMGLLQQWMREYCLNQQPLYDFESQDGVRHSVYQVTDSQTLINLQMLFEDAESLYIADGHHRCAAAAACARQNPNNTAAQHFLGVVFPSEELKIMDYNRVLKNNGKYNVEALFEMLEKSFEVEQVQEVYYKPTKAHEFGMRYDKNWYKLALKEELLEGLSVVEQLDASLLQKLVLEPIFEIHDPRIDEKIDFVGGIRGIEELNKRTDAEMDVAFSLYPTSVKDLMTIADQGDVMPPKSTWFEPKLLSGLFIHCI
ncbi:MAG: DUF1015 domain-containing protein [Cellulosilyticaceae bacterium]